jgi:DHA2 family methylenomycin A resistance protein-like MFS transporter
MLIAGGAAPLLAIDADWAWPLFLASLIVVGVGIGVSSSPVHTSAIQAAEGNETGQAAGLFSTMRYLGSILGSAGMAAILSGPRPSVADFRTLYIVLFVAAVGATATAARLPSRATEGELQPTGEADDITTSSQRVQPRST